MKKAITKAGQNLDGRDIRVDASTGKPKRDGGFGGGFGGGRGGGRGGRGGFGGNPMDRAKKTGAIPSNTSTNAVMKLDDEDDE